MCVTKPLPFATLYYSILFCSLQRFKELFLLRSSLIVLCVSVLRIDFSVMVFDASTMNATNSHKHHPFIGSFNSTYVTIYMAKNFHRSCHKLGSQHHLLPCRGICGEKKPELGKFFSQLVCCTLSFFIDQCSIFIYL